MNTWKPNDWRAATARQMPDYPDADKLAAAEARLSALPPLVFAGEARALQKSLGRVAAGEAFLLQGGDCAESFAEFSANGIRDTLRVILQMAVVLTYGSAMPVVKVGRMAGQFAKPRSEPTETIGGVTLPSYRGDIINDITFTADARTPDPARMVDAYHQCAATLNLLRAFTKGGYADLTRVGGWALEFAQNSPLNERYEQLARQIQDAIAFMHACGVTGETIHTLRETDFYTSHEALLLHYEEALTRVDSTTGDWYDTSAHFLWIGARTGQLDGAQITFAKGIKNPLGLKVGPDVTPDALCRLIDILNPDGIAGRLTLIGRFGADKIAGHLPALMRAVKSHGCPVVWSCDPMHGNTRKTADGIKTRSFEDVLSEIRSFFKIAGGEGVHAGGIHLEMTGRKVTECTGGQYKLSDADLAECYATNCDPRLNASQALELAFILAEEIKAAKRA